LVPFHIYTFVGSWPFCLALAYLGKVLGDAWDSDPRVKAAFHSADVVIGVALLAAGGWYVWHRISKIRQARS
jgi:membrane protein DedA with SNARE-associated domain